IRNGASPTSCGSGSSSWPWDCCLRNGTSTTVGFTFEPAMPTPSADPASKATGATGLRRVLESKDPKRRSFADYRRYIQRHYDGLPGALTAVTGRLTGHETLAGRLIRRDGFDIKGRKRILDARCGNGRYTKFLLAEADVDAVI